MHVLVIGAGIIGVTTAFELRQRGFEVTVVDRHAGVAQEASYGNAGVISTAYAGPWASRACRRRFSVICGAATRR